MLYAIKNSNLNNLNIEQIKPLGFTDLVPIENDNTEADQTYNTEVGIVFCDLKHVRTSFLYYISQFNLVS